MISIKSIKSNQRSQGPIRMSNGQVFASSFELSEPKFPYLEIGDKNTIQLLEGFVSFCFVFEIIQEKSCKVLSTISDN